MVVFKGPRMWALPACYHKVFKTDSFRCGSVMVLTRHQFSEITGHEEEPWPFKTPRKVLLKGSGDTARSKHMQGVAYRASDVDPASVLPKRIQNGLFSMRFRTGFGKLNGQFCFLFGTLGLRPPS